MAGIEQNPGPSRTVWTCSVCKSIIRGNTTSVKCNKCNEWCHFKKCSGLKCVRLWNQGFVATCCTTPSGTTTTNSKNSPTQSVSPSFDAVTSSCNILQLNCDGLRGKIHDITRFMEKRDLLIAAIQETKLSSKVNLQLPGYSVIRSDRERDKGGGLAFIISDKVKYRTYDLPAPATNDITIEQQAIAVTSGTSEIILVNIYIPPITCSPPGYKTNIEHLLTLTDCVLLGDFNAHHSTWHSALNEDARGTDLADQIDQSDFGVLNDESSTRSSGNIISSPDITLASASLLACTEWYTEPKFCSDHLPIIVELSKIVEKQKSGRKYYTNFAKADWVGFRDHTELKFSRTRPSKNVNLGERTFRSIVRKAARIFIPAGCYKEIRPNFPTSAARIADERDILRESDPDNPRIQEMSKEIRKRVNEHLRNKWRDHLSKSSFKPNSRSLWHTIKRLSKPQEKTSNVILSHNDKPMHDDKKCANAFNQLFTVHPQKSDKSIRNTIRKIHQLETDSDIRFDDQQVATAIKATKSSKASGPDGISPIMLKHLGPQGITFLTALLNLSLSTLIIPGLWKVGKIIPLLKPGKPVEQTKSYRPISLLSPVAKLLEALLLPTLATHLQPVSHQHGFRKGHSTTTALHVVTDHIQNGLNQRRPNLRTVLVALDLTRAFDTVNHSILLKDVLNSSLPIIIKRWMANYMRGRQTFVDFRNKASKYRKLKQGVPQGGVLSPLLFNFYMSDLPTPPGNIKIVSYADDITLLCTTSNIPEACESINEYLVVLNQWLNDRNLVLSPEKSSATLFTTWNLEVNNELDVSVANKMIPTVKKPRILGVMFDNLMTFSQHVNETCNKLRMRNNVLKSLAGSTWGKNKETLVTTFKAIGRSVINYAAPIWSPQISDTSWKKLQTAQNAALRIATGCHLMASQDHLHEETKMLPVKQHNDLLSQQYLLRCHLPGHPCHAAVTDTPPPRSIRKGLVKVHLHQISEHIPSDGLTITRYKEGLNKLHSDIVGNTIGSYINRVLNTGPPPINEEEKILPRTTRSTLAQLRSGWCRLLNHYLARIDPEISDTCPLCGCGPHDTRHLFECPSKPTALNILSLWTKPIEAASFLDLDTEPAVED